MIRSYAIVAALVVAAVPRTQEYRWESIEALGVKVRVHKKLKAVPITLGEGQNVIELHRRARFDPESRQQAIMKGPQPFNWGMDVFAFDPPPQFEGEAETQVEIRRRAQEMRRYEAGARSFEQFLKSKDPRSSITEFHGRAGGDGRDVKGHGGIPDHRLWEYSIPAETDGEPKVSFRWYSVAAAYRLGAREIALVFTWPVFKDKPDSKYLKIAKTMVESLEVDEHAQAGLTGDERAEFANTPERMKRLEAAVAGIAGIEGWDWFTTPGCAVLYSFKPGSRGTRERRDAEDVAEHLAAIHEKYRETFPPIEGMPEIWPVLRVCHDLETFRDYGNPPRGAESMFNPAASEIVVTADGEQSAEALAAREGWLNYAMHCFRGARLAPWFAFGFGDWFACWKQSGRRWKFEPNETRIDGDDGAEELFDNGENVSLGELVDWPDARFVSSETNEDADKWLGQAYSLVDFLMRGPEKLGSQWNETWSEIIPRLTAELHKSRNASRANNAAFGSIDTKEFEAAWAEWVDSQLSRR